MTAGHKRVWQNMITRCKHNPDYFSRGITVCSEWLSYETFKRDMGLCPGKELDRIDNDKGYYKENCRWVTHSQNNFNKRPQTNNTSGIIGVSYEKDRRGYVAKWARDILYRGPDLFEALCARKSAEAAFKESLT